MTYAYKMNYYRVDVAKLFDDPVEQKGVKGHNIEIILELRKKIYE